MNRLLLILIFTHLAFCSSLLAQDFLDIRLNRKAESLQSISSGIFCLENNDSLTFAYQKAIEGMDYVFQGIFVYGQTNLGQPELLFSIPSISAPLTIALRDLIPENKIPPFEKGGTKISVRVSRVLRVNGKRAEEIINIPQSEILPLTVVSGCKAETKD
ncbi:MAG: hypothetical protein MRZ79_20640 [Bacteroidia bacterium]|nr:hypothetical protein [Bacteroidia bacterium]